MGINDYFVFAGVDCRKFGIHAFDNSTFGAFAMQYDINEIPGRDGDLLVSQGRYPNVDMTFSCLIYKDSYTNFRNFRAWLLSKVGYQRLESSVHPNEFYLACFKDEIAPVIDKDATMGKFDLVFSRKPQRFLKNGERKITMTSSGSITNPTLFSAPPLLRVYGSGAFSIGGQNVSINTTDAYTDIDCEIMESYKDTLDNLKNDKVVLSGNDYPSLSPGSNTITLGNGITKIEITPRWFTR